MEILMLLLFFFAVILVAVIAGLRFIMMQKQRKASNEKMQFFINTAHDIRTPLTLIKAPLEETIDKEKLSPGGEANLRTALRNVNALMRLTTNLINIEQTEAYGSELYIAEYELHSYLEETCNALYPYAESKNIELTYESNFQSLHVWIDKGKIDSILKNILSNALKFTPEHGNIRVSACEDKDSWSVEVKDTGIGIPEAEQKKLFKRYFRGSNAINAKVAGSGIGLMLASKLVHIHKGRITLSSIENQGTSVKVTFPKEHKKYRKARLAVKIQVKVPEDIAPYETSPIHTYEETKKKQNRNLQRLMIVEDNDELRNYLEHTLSEDYAVQTYDNGKDALKMVKDCKPELIISDIMMPGMQGDELSAIIKNDIETSHIPIILLTALNDEKNILNGLKTGADEYVVKPFNIGILKATIANLLTNRALLRNKYAKLELNTDNSCSNCTKDIDWKFVANVKRNVDENMSNPAFNVDMLCTLMNMSRTSFYNKIKALTDQAPADYVRLIRLKHAAQLLKTGTYSVTEVAEMTGFNDPKYFREVFKKHYHMSPSKYAKEK